MPLPPVIGAAVLPTIAAFLIKALIAHLIMRVITVLGIAIVSYVAIDMIKNQIVSYIQSALSVISGDVRNIAEMMGFFDCMNIILSAYIAAVSIRELRGIYNRLVFGQSIQ